MREREGTPKALAAVLSIRRSATASVSISGYHIAEAGANPISQLAFTLANGFTYVEYYLSRGMDINAFAPNLSFFFSNGMDPEYAVMGRVARRRGASEFAGQMP